MALKLDGAHSANASIRALAAANQSWERQRESRSTPGQMVDGDPVSIAFEADDRGAIANLSK
jgi:hypothetical protein